MNSWILFPPVAFGVLLLAVVLLEVASRRLAPKGTDSPGKEKAYACGEDPVTNRVQPNYGEFFPFAFFFTIMHVVALMLATIPQDGLAKFAGIAALYFLVAMSGLLILFRDKIERDLAKLFTPVPLRTFVSERIRFMLSCVGGFRARRKTSATE